MTLFLKHKNILKLAIILSVFFGFFLGFNNGSVSATSQTFTFNSSSHPAQYERFQFNSFTPTYFDFYCSDFSNGDVNTLRLSYSSFDSFSANSSVTLTCSRGYVANSSTNSTRVYLPSGYPVKFFSLEGSATFHLIFSDEPTGGIVPSGSLSITENGTYDVSLYAEAVVDVPQDVTEIVEDPISNDFQKVFFEIVKNIIPAFGILLVVWFGIDMLSSLIFGRGR